MNRECSTTCIIIFISVGGHLALIKWEGALVRRFLAVSQVWLGTDRLGLCHQVVTIILIHHLKLLARTIAHKIRNTLKFSSYITIENDIW